MMVFSKSFPKKGLAGYPEWEEVIISGEDEKLIDEKARMENIALFSQCIDDAKSMLIKKGLMENDVNVVNAAVALFEKRASHSIYFKERKAKEKFDSLQK
jgi:hypothetical protein